MNISSSELSNSSQCAFLDYRSFEMHLDCKLSTLYTVKCIEAISQAYYDTVTIVARLICSLKVRRQLLNSDDDESIYQMVILLIQRLQSLKVEKENTRRFFENIRRVFLLLLAFAYRQFKAVVWCDRWLSL